MTGQYPVVIARKPASKAALACDGVIAIAEDVADPCWSAPDADLAGRPVLTAL